MTKTKNYRTGLWEAYRTSFKNFTLAAEKLQATPVSDTIAREMAMEQVERARAAYSRSRDAFMPELSGKPAVPTQTAVNPQTYACCA